MNKILSITIVSLALIVVSFFAGLFLQRQIDKGLISSLQTTNTKIISSLGSVITKTSMHGYVKNISGNVISLYYGDAKAEVVMRPNATVYMPLKAGSVNTTKTNLSSVEVDDFVTIFTELNNKGELEGTGLYISSPFTNPDGTGPQK